MNGTRKTRKRIETHCPPGALPSAGYILPAMRSTDTAHAMPDMAPAFLLYSTITVAAAKDLDACPEGMEYPDALTRGVPRTREEGARSPENLLQYHTVEHMAQRDGHRYQESCPPGPFIKHQDQSDEHPDHRGIRRWVTNIMSASPASLLMFS